jgi:Mrp family chromosome partitioning ATPase
VNLAATIALSGKKVLIIGMDIRNPKVVRVFPSCEVLLIIWQKPSITSYIDTP